MGKKLFGLVEVDNEEETTAQPTAVVTTFEGSTPPATIEAIYTQAGLVDAEVSINKVMQLKKALPDSLASDVLKQTLIGVMQASGLGYKEVMADAKARVDALTEAKNGFGAVTSEKVAANSAKISELEAEIDALKTGNNEALLAQEKQAKAIDAEMQALGDIMSFIS